LFTKVETRDAQIRRQNASNHILKLKNSSGGYTFGPPQLKTLFQSRRKKGGTDEKIRIEMEENG